jgi:hypothetical protein
MGVWGCSWPGKCQRIGQVCVSGVGRINVSALVRPTTGSCPGEAVGDVRVGSDAVELVVVNHAPVGEAVLVVEMAHAPVGVLIGGAEG